MTPSKQIKLLAGGLFASIALNLGLVGYLANSGGLRRILLRLDLVELPHDPAQFQIDDVETFRLLPNTPGEVVFAGDSLVNDGRWSEFFTPIRSRGIGGQRTDELLKRLDEILESRPSRLFLLVGSNDLSQAVPPAQLLRHYRTILERVKAGSPATAVVICGLLPVNQKFKNPPAYSNEDVHAVNEGLARLAAEFPPARFLDLTPELADEHGDLKPELSKDGLHLNVRGYLAIQDKVRAALELP